MLRLKLSLFIGIIFFNLSLLHAKTLRILPLGDSLTYDNNHQDIDDKPRPISKRYAYRGPLWKMLKDAKVDFDFVGTKKAGKDYAEGFDTDNDGYPGEDSFQIAERTYKIMEATQPDVVLLHVGTNDHGAKMEGVNKILDDIDIFEESNSKDVRVFVALIVDRRESDGQIKFFNGNLKKLIQRRWEKGDMLTLVDMYHKAGLNKNDYADRTHPNAKGYTKMAKVWFDALQTPYVAFSTAPFTKDDKVSAETGTTVSINILSNDKDYQNDMDASSANFVGGSSTLSVKGEGKWRINKDGIVTFRPNASFTSDPTPVQYTVKDAEGSESKPATITIDYSNSSLESYPTSIVDDSYIESLSIHEETNSVEFITRVPDSGLKF